jgi:hypothetical protein
MGGVSGAGGASAGDGSTGSGGVGQGGSGGANAAGGSPGAGGTGPCDAPGIIVCDDFESGIKNFQLPAQAQVTVDTTRHHSGNSAIKLAGSSAPSNHISTPPNSIPASNAFYMRAWVNFEKDLTAMGGHVAYIVGSVADDNSGDEVRLGSSKNLKGNPMIDLNWQGPGHAEITQFSNGDVNGVGGGTDTPGTTLMANRWYCIEAFFNGRDSEFQLWIDNTEITSLHVTDWAGQRTGTQRAWAPTYRFLKVGAQNYSGDVGTVWYDDVAMGTLRIGCNGP